MPKKNLGCKNVHTINFALNLRNDYCVENFKICPKITTSFHPVGVAQLNIEYPLSIMCTMSRYLCHHVFFLPF